LPSRSRHGKVAGPLASLDQLRRGEPDPAPAPQIACGEAPVGALKALVTSHAQRFGELSQSITPPATEKHPADQPVSLSSCRPIGPLPRSQSLPTARSRSLPLTRIPHPCRLRAGWDDPHRMRLTPRRGMAPAPRRFASAEETADRLGQGKPYDPSSR
jgi:hypothetical protein